ncbi:MAG TPA: cysteine desulfurase family protein [Methyloceanibacter sp.]|nr:cysteine desulfurase family protein [Methyloceanibacter sp.]
MTTRSYLDYNATAPLRPEVREAIVAALDAYGNPSSVHAEGREARALIESARAKVAALASARAEDVIFTSGGSEANALALAAQAGEAWHCYISTVEHPSVLVGGRFCRESTTRIPVSSDGVIDLDVLAAKLAKHHVGGRRPFVSLMAANNETGAIQPVAVAAEIVHAAGGLLHTDAVQVAGRLPLDFGALGADMMTLSAHKLGGPKGVGVLVLREGVAVEPLIKGGGQEWRRRAGTENVAGIVGFGVAAELAAAELEKAAALVSLRDGLETRALEVEPGTVVVSGRVARLPNTSCIAVPGTKAETLVIGLDLAQVAVSAGSACSSGKVEPSHVLSAMGLSSELAQGAIRVSLGFGTTSADIERFISAWSELIKRMLRRQEAA